MLVVFRRHCGDGVWQMHCDHKRQEIVDRCTSQLNQALDIQFVLGQEELTAELLKMLKPIDLEDPKATGTFNTNYFASTIQTWLRARFGALSIVGAQLECLASWVA